MPKALVIDDANEDVGLDLSALEPIGASVLWKDRSRCFDALEPIIGDLIKENEGALQSYRRMNRNNVYWTSSLRTA